MTSMSGPRRSEWRNWSVCIGIRSSAVWWPRLKIGAGAVAASIFSAKWDRWEWIRVGGRSRCSREWREGQKLMVQAVCHPPFRKVRGRIGAPSFNFGREETPTTEQGWATRQLLLDSPHSLRVLPTQPERLLVRQLCTWRFWTHIEQD